MSTSRLAAQRRSIQAALVEYSQSVHFDFDPKAFHDSCLKFFTRQWDGIQFLNESKPAPVPAAPVSVEAPQSAERLKRKRPLEVEEPASTVDKSDKVEDTEETLQASSVEAQTLPEPVELSATSTPRRKIPALRLFHTLQPSSLDVCTWLSHRPPVFAPPVFEERLWLIVPFRNIPSFLAASTRPSITILMSKLSHIRHNSSSEQMNVLIETDEGGISVSVSRSRTATTEDLLNGRAQHHSSVNQLRLTTGRCTALCRTVISPTAGDERECPHVILATHSAVGGSYLQVLDIIKPEVVGEPFHLPVSMMVVALSASVLKTDDALSITCLFQDGSILIVHFHLTHTAVKPHLLALLDCADIYRVRLPPTLHQVPSFASAVSVGSAEMTASLLLTKSEVTLSAFVAISSDFMPPLAASPQAQLQHLMSGVPKSATEWEALPHGFVVDVLEPHTVQDDMTGWTIRDLQQASDVLAGFHLKDRFLSALKQMVDRLWNDAKECEDGRERLKRIFIDGFLRDWQQQVEATLKPVTEREAYSEIRFKAEQQAEEPPWLMMAEAKKDYTHNRRISSALRQRGFGKSYMRPMWSHSLLAQMDLSLGTLLLDVWSNVLCGETEEEHLAVLRDLLGLMTVPSDELDVKVDEAALAADKLVESQHLVTLSTEKTIEGLRANLYLSAMDTLLNFVALRSSTTTL